MKLNRYNGHEIQQLLNTMQIVCDTREKEGKNLHILDYLETKGVEVIREKLEHGDYTAVIPANEKYGLVRPLCFHDVISIERKMDLSELSNNLTQGRKAFENEMLRAKGKLILLVENNTYEDIIKHNYRTKFEPKSFIATLKAFECRYNIQTNFVQKAYSGNYIYHTLYYAVREYLKNSTIRQAI